MSLTISTDVFCDGAGCSQWTHGCTGPRTDAKAARKIAKREGWGTAAGRDFCPACVAKMKAAKAAREAGIEPPR